MADAADDVRHSPLTWWLFDRGFSLFRRALLRPTRFGGDWPAGRDGVPLLLVANHVSWWDGFLLREVQRSVRARAPFHTVVVEHQLAAHPVLRRLGGVPVDPDTPSSVLGMLRTLAALRQRDPDTVFAYFPQGRIWPTSRRPLSLRRGVDTVSRLLAPVRVVPVAIHIEPVVDVRPTPFVWLCDAVELSEGESLAPDALEWRLAHGLDQIRTRLDAWGEDVVAAWPDAPLSAPSPKRGAARGPASAPRAPSPVPDVPASRATSS